MILEACVETFEEAIRAETLGADRIELCANLNVGGTTPSYALIESVRSKLNIPIMVMIRPRGGDFVYNRMELRNMKQSIEICKSIPVAGVVFGILNNDHRINIEDTAYLANCAAPLDVTFHKAIDETPELLDSVKKLIGIQSISRILTSGGMPTAREGAAMINEMIHTVQNHLTILAAGRITNKNLKKMSELLHTNEFHGRKIVGELK
jgi:copper homeostasis protein